MGGCLRRKVQSPSFYCFFLKSSLRYMHFTEINNIHRHEKVQCSHFPAKKVKVGQVSKLSLVDTLSCFLTLIRLGLIREGLKKVIFITLGLDCYTYNRA